jgi:signal transduction histidine kinase/ActR/RegA family two-component response regulator
MTDSTAGRFECVTDDPETRRASRSPVDESSPSSEAALHAREIAVVAREAAVREREGVARDLAEFDALAAQLREANGHLVMANLLSQELVEEAEEANHLKDEFVAMVSHELRTPLNVVLGWARILGSRHLPPDREQHAIRAIERNAASLTLIIDDLLDVSRIIAGTLTLSEVPVDLVVITRDACSAAGPSAAAKGINLVYPVDTAMTEWVAADPNRLQQAIGNLLANAVKFTPAGGRVVVSIARVGQQSVVEVTDTGLGIGPAFLPHVFERFRQARGGASRPHDGLGLGLTIVRKIVELHGGTVDAASEGEGRGATFVIRLPVLPIGADADGAGGAERRATPRDRRLAASLDVERLDALHILLVDDDEDGGALASLVLTDLGARVTTAVSAHDARRALMVELPDIMVSDIGMPAEDGYSLIRRIREYEATHGGFLPAIALTGYAGDTDRRRALAAGFQAHVAKPLQPAELVGAITRITRGLPRPTVGDRYGTIDT